MLEEELAKIRDNMCYGFIGLLLSLLSFTSSMMIISISKILWISTCRVSIRLLDFRSTFVENMLKASASNVNSIQVSDDSTK